MFTPLLWVSLTGFTLSSCPLHDSVSSLEKSELLHDVYPFTYHLWSQDKIPSDFISLPRNLSIIIEDTFFILFILVLPCFSSPTPFSLYPMYFTSLIPSGEVLQQKTLFRMYYCSLAGVPLEPLHLYTTPSVNKPRKSHQSDLVRLFVF